MAYTRRQELMCTEAQMIAKPNVVLRENEVIYIKMNDGTLRQKIGDGVTTIINLPFTNMYDASGALAKVEQSLKKAEDAAALAVLYNGKSAYAYAKEGGYTGTEAEFAEDINPDNIKKEVVPVKGVDYFDGVDGDDYVLTGADMTEIARMIENATIVEAPKYVNSVEEMTDTDKIYVLASTGRIWAALSTMTEQEMTEQIVGTDDNPWGVGRLSSGNPNGIAGYVTTPYIDLTKYSVPFELHLEGIPFVYNSDGNRRYSQYKTDKTHIQTEMNQAPAFQTYWKNAVFTDNGDETCTISFTPPITNKSDVTIGYVRFSGQGTEANANVYVKYSGTVYGEPVWTDTGMVYAPVSGDEEDVGGISEFSLVNPAVKAFMETADYDDDDYSYTQVNDYTSSDYYRKDLPFPVILGWKRSESVVQYTVSINTDYRVLNTGMQTYYTKDNSMALYNLIPNSTYYYKVYGLRSDSTTILIKDGSFTTTADRTRMLNIDGIQNVRDIGGYTGTSGDKVKYGMLYRGSAMDEGILQTTNITDAGKQEMVTRLRILTDLDLRGANNVTASALGSSVYFYTPPYSYLSYANAITDATSKGYFKDMLEYIVSQLSKNLPVYIHCSGGCDRTGTLVFLLLGLLGVSESDLAKEYELSSFSPIGRKTRIRNSTVYDYKGMVGAIKAYGGTTFTNNFVLFAIDCGLDGETITEFMNLMLE